MDELEKIVAELAKSREPSLEIAARVRNRVLSPPSPKLDAYEMTRDIFKKAFAVCDYFYEQTMKNAAHGWDWSWAGNFSTTAAMSG